MLTNAQIEQMSYELVPLFQDLEQDTIKDIARRVEKSKRWTESAEIEARSLRDLGYSPAKIRSEVMKKLNADPEYKQMIADNTIEYKQKVKARISDTVSEAKKQGNELIANAGNMSFSGDLAFWSTRARKVASKSHLATINKTFSKRMNDELNTLSHSLGFRLGTGEYVPLSKAYNKATDRTIVSVASGTTSVSEAVQNAVNELEKSGIRKIDYASGISRNVDTAVALSTRTTISQMTGSIAMDNADVMDEDLVEVSSHTGARNEGEGPANHASWQGKVYSISGRPHIEESERLGYDIQKLSEVTGYPDNPAGLMGYNCRHSFYTFFEGISTPNPMAKDPDPVVVDGKKYDYYHAKQHQRQIERQLRTAKRQYIGGNTSQLAMIKAKEQEYARFCKKVDLKQNLNALYVNGYKRDFAYIKEGTIEDRLRKIIGVDDKGL